MKIKSTLIVTTALVFTSLGIVSCKKNNTGGKASFHVQVFHHNVPINNSVVYVKFGTQDQPSDPKNNYDLKAVGEPRENHVHIEDLQIGEYYLYAVGYDSIAKMPVEGGMAAKIRWSERKEMKEVNLSIGHH